jgi:imidazolonepropionase-like amidohydrolase
MIGKLALILAGILLASTAAAQSETVVYEGGQVWNGSAFVPGTVAVSEGRIVEPGAAGARRVDATGKYLVPAYGNAHAHVTGADERSSRSYTDVGVFYVWNPTTIVIRPSSRPFTGGRMPMT